MAKKSTTGKGHPKESCFEALSEQPNNFRDRGSKQVNAS